MTDTTSTNEIEDLIKELEVIENTEVRVVAEGILTSFKNADPVKLKAMMPLIKQAGYTQYYLDVLNGKAVTSGLVEFHPENAKMQRPLPVSKALQSHTAALTNIMDKLMKHLGDGNEEEGDGLDDYE